MRVTGRNNTKEFLCYNYKQWTCDTKNLCIYEKNINNTNQSAKYSEAVGLKAFMMSTQAGNGTLIGALWQSFSVINES